MTEEQRQQLWYQSRDYAAIDKESNENLRACQGVNGDLARLQRDHYCLRGLEMKTSPHINRLRRLRANITVRAVLDTQNHCRKMSKGAASAESLAAVSQQYTQQAKNRARELGLIDSIEANLQR